MRCLRISIVSVVLSVSLLKYFLPHSTFRFNVLITLLKHQLRLHDFKRRLDEIRVVISGGWRRPSCRECPCRRFQP